MTTGASGPRRVAVIGAGIAGTGAAFAAARAGATVLVFDGGPGASALATGAIDLEPWAGAPYEAAVPRPVRHFLAAAGGYTLGANAAVATTAGVVRRAAGHDASVLDVSQGEGPIGVVECDRPGWDARSLARAWGPRFEPLAATALRHADERTIPDVDFAARHDDPDRLAWLAERLREALARRGGAFGALVLPPMLGLRPGAATALSPLAGLRCGEATALPGGPAGRRFERVRDDLLLGERVEVVKAVATAAERTAEGWRVLAAGRAFDAAAVVVATGGLLGGGIAYRGPDDSVLTGHPPRVEPPLVLTLTCPLVCGTRGRPIDPPSSTFGGTPETIAWPAAQDPLLERAGALVDANGQSPAPGLFAAGDVVADRPRAWLAALLSGLLAGAAACPRPP